MTLHTLRAVLGLAVVAAADAYGYNCRYCSSSRFVSQTVCESQCPGICEWDFHDMECKAIHEEEVNPVAMVVGVLFSMLFYILVCGCIFWCYMAAAQRAQPGQAVYIAAPDHAHPGGMYHQMPMHYQPVVGRPVNMHPPPYQQPQPQPPPPPPLSRHDSHVSVCEAAPMPAGTNPLLAGAGEGGTGNADSSGPGAATQVE